MLCDSGAMGDAVDGRPAPCTPSIPAMRLHSSDPGWWPRERLRVSRVRRRNVVSEAIYKYRAGEQSEPLHICAQHTAVRCVRCCMRPLPVLRPCASRTDPSHDNIHTGFFRMQRTAHGLSRPIRSWGVWLEWARREMEQS